jgi:hypothetical protein
MSTAEVTCPSCGEPVTCAWKCEHCEKPRPFGTDDGAGRGSQNGGQR